MGKPQREKLTPYSWTTGRKHNLEPVRLIANGASGEVHEIRNIPSDVIRGPYTAAPRWMLFGEVVPTFEKF